MSKGKIVPNECAAEGVETHTHGPPMGCQWPGRFPPGFWGSCCLLRNVLVPIPVTSTVAAVEVRDSSGQGLAGVLREQFPRAPGCSRNLHSLPELFRLRNPPQAETACRRAEAQMLLLTQASCSTLACHVAPMGPSFLLETRARSSRSLTSTEPASIVRSPEPSVSSFVARHRVLTAPSLQLAEARQGHSRDAAVCLPSGDLERTRALNPASA